MRTDKSSEITLARSKKQQINKILLENPSLRVQLGIDSTVTLGEYLGGGSFGYVFELVNTAEGSTSGEVIKFAHTGAYGDKNAAIHIGKMYEIATIAEILRDLQAGGIEEEQHIVKPISSATGSDIDGEYYLIRMRRENPIVSGASTMPRIEWRIGENESLTELTVRLGLDIATALEFLHSKGYVHRDVKLSNIFYTIRRSDDEISFLLGDFDTCRKIADSPNKTVSNSTNVYTKGYCPPGWETMLDPRRDVYALGVSMYVMLNGFSEENLEKMQANYRKPQVSYRDDWFIPPKGGTQELHQILRKALNPDINSNYKSSQEFHSALKRYYSSMRRFKRADFQEHTPAVVHNETTIDRVSNHHFSQAMTVIAGILAVLLIISIASNRIAQRKYESLTLQNAETGSSDHAVEQEESEQEKNNTITFSNGDTTETNYMNNSGEEREYESEVYAQEIEMQPKIVAFHDLKLIDTDDQMLFGDHYNGQEVQSLYGEQYTGYYELVCYSDYDRIATPYVECLTNGEYTKFTGTVFAGETMLDEDHAEFVIFADGNQIYTTGNLTRRDDPIKFEVDIAGARTVTIMSKSGDYHLMETNPRIIATDLKVSQ